jgi:flagellar basal body-associated protein FliL
MYRIAKITSAVFLAIVMVTLLSVPAFASAPAEKKEEKKTEEGGLFSNSQTFFVRMDPMVLPVINDRGIQEIISILIALEVKDQRDIERVNGMTTKLNDAYMRNLYGKLDKRTYRNGKFLDVNKLKTQLTSITEEVVGKGLVQNVLIQGVTQRHFN